jgi:hypothetical protein
MTCGYSNRKRTTLQQVVLENMSLPKITMSIDVACLSKVSQFKDMVRDGEGLPEIHIRPFEPVEISFTPRGLGVRAPHRPPLF